MVVAEHFRCPKHRSRIDGAEGDVDGTRPQVERERFERCKRRLNGLRFNEQVDVFGRTRVTVNGHGKTSANCEPEAVSRERLNDRPELANDVDEGLHAMRW